MEISNDKISELLNNPEIVGMIASLASGFSKDAPGNKSEISELPEDFSENSQKAFEDVQPEIPSDILPPRNYSDKRIALLQAIKPYISDTKKGKVDSLVKAIGVAGILNTYSGTLLGGLFGSK
jgi:hypothetical protein